MTMEKNNEDLGLRAFVISWNNKFPFDFYMRTRLQIKFNSKKHRKMNLIDSLIQMEEEIITVELRRESEQRAKRAIKYMKTGIWLEQEKEESLKVTDEEFDNLDISKL